MPTKTKPHVNATFKLVFISVLVIVAICLITCAILVSQSNLSPQADTLFRTTLSVFQIGAGAIIGLLGGNALSVKEESQREVR